MTVDEALAWEAEHAAYTFDMPRSVMRVLAARVREVETLLEALSSCKSCDAIDELCETCGKAYETVRAVKVTT